MTIATRMEALRDSATLVSASIEVSILTGVRRMLTRPGVWVPHPPWNTDTQCLATAIGVCSLERGGTRSHGKCISATLAAIYNLYPQYTDTGIAPFNDSHTLLDVLVVVDLAIKLVDHLPERREILQAPYQIGANDVIVSLPQDAPKIDQSIWNMPGYIVAKPHSYYTLKTPTMMFID